MAYVNDVVTEGSLKAANFKTEAYSSTTLGPFSRDATADKTILSISLLKGDWKKMDASAGGGLKIKTEIQFKTPTYQVASPLFKN